MLKSTKYEKLSSFFLLTIAIFVAVKIAVYFIGVLKDFMRQDLPVGAFGVYRSIFPGHTVVLILRGSLR